MERERDSPQPEEAERPRAAAAAAPLPAILAAGNHAVARVAQLHRETSMPGLGAAAALDRLAAIPGPVLARHPDEGPMGRLRESEVQLAGESAQAAGWLGDAAVKIYLLKRDLDKSIAEGKPVMGENTLEVASRLHQIAEAIEKLGVGISSLHAKVKDSESSLQTQTDIDKAVTQLGRVINGLQAIKSAQKAQSGLEAFQKAPGPETADQWADGVTEVFDSFGKVVGSLNLPPGLTWMTDFFSGMLGAPKAYVSFFRATMRARYAKMDREVGRLEEYKERLTQGEKVMWAGPSTSMVTQAWSFDYKLQEWIFAHKEAGDRNLWVLGQKDVAAILATTLEKDKAVDEDSRTRWGGFFAKYM